MSASSDHEGAKRRKETSEGADWRQCDDHHEETERCEHDDLGFEEMICTIGH